MNDEQFFLANAYLDGELTVEERAIADADPDVMAAVEELRALQALVRDVDPPSSATRDAAVAAAMATFAAGDATDTAVSTAGSHDRTVRDPIPFRSRPSYAKYLAVAAGVLGVGLFGVAVANLDTGGDDDSADESAAEEPADEPAEAAELDRATEDQPMAADGGDDADQEVASAEAPSEATADEPAMDTLEEPAEEPADEPAEEPAEEPATGALPRPEVLPGQVLTTPEELGSFGTDLLEQLRDGTLGPTPNHACPIDDVLGRSEYQADDAIVPILVAVDEPNGIVLAFADETCEPVAEGPLYLP